MAVVAFGIPMPAQIVNMVKLDHMADWAGLDGDGGDEDTARGHLYHLLGANGDMNPVMVGMVDSDSFEVAVNSWQPNGMPPTFVHSNAAKLFAKLCRIYSGTEPNPNAAPAAAQSSSLALAAAPLSQPALRKVKLSSVINQMDDTEFTPTMRGG